MMRPQGVDFRIVTAGFELFIKKRYEKNPALMLFTLTHERRDLAERECLKQIRIAEAMPRLRFDRKKLELLIATAAGLFCDLAKAAKEKQMMTAAELKRLETNSEENRMQSAQEMVDDMEKEYQRSLVSKTFAAPATRLEDVEHGQEGHGHESGPGRDRGNGPEVRPTGGYSEVPGTDA